MTDEERIQYGLSLFARLGEAVILKQANVKIGNWVPQPHYCHDNVRAWTENRPAHKHVFGYVYFDLSLVGYVEFAAHSAVEFEDGTLFDITPHGASQQYPFIRHTGTEAEFADIASDVRIRVPSDRLPGQG